MQMLNKRLDSFVIQDRDFTLLCGLFESRVMTADHISMLYFGAKRPYTTKRLQKLKAAGLVSERSRRMNEPSVLFLTRKGFKLLNSQGLLEAYPPLGVNSFEARANVSDRTLRHELEIMDVKAAFHAALGKSEQFSIVTFKTWPILYQFETSSQGHGRDCIVKPDGFIRLHEKEAGTKGFMHDCFLEVDRSSKTQDALADQAARYLDYYQSGGHAVRNGASRADYKGFPFRVLIVLKSAERRNNAAERLLQRNPPILTQAWLATLSDATTNPLGAIWFRPIDYRDAIRGTPFDPDQKPNACSYSRQTEREASVESRVKKHSLLI